MRQITLSSLVKHRFVHCVNRRGQSARDIVQSIGVSPGVVCAIIAGKNTETLPIETYYRIARWLTMPLSNVMQLANAHPKLPELVQLGLRIQGRTPTSTHDQELAARDARLSPATFRRALHGYADFSPSLRTCDRLAAWLSLTGFTADDIAASAGMLIRYTANGRRVAVSTPLVQAVKSYPCACGRPGCMVPAHVPYGPRRKWRSNACRMWSARRARRSGISCAHQTRSTTPYPTAPVRFIMINERRFPVRS